MKIVSFNIRCDYQQDGKNNFCYRRDSILKKIADEKPDIIGFQETLPHVQQWLNENLRDYTVVGCGREKDFSDESMTVAIRRDSAQLMWFEVFWLSPQPQEPGSRYQEQSICPRTCSVATIKFNDIKTPIRVYNTHLDHEGAKARELGLGQIYEKIKADKKQFDFPIVLMGDFNAEPDSDEMSLIKTDSEIKLKDAAEGLGITYHEYGNLKASCKIDYLLTDSRFTCTNAYLWKDCSDGVYLSDHYPVCGEYKL